MELILLQNIKKLGSTGDIVKVSTGFARNYLLPNKLACLSNMKNKEVLQQKQKEVENANMDRREKASYTIKQIQNKPIVVVRAATEDGRLYSSVKREEIVLALEIFSSGISPKNVFFMDDKIKHLGIYKILIHFYDDAETTIQVAIARSESEGKQLLLQRLQNRQ